MSKLSKNILYNFAGKSILLVLGFISVKYVYSQLGEDSLGIIYFAGAINAVLQGVLAKGLNSTTVREISSQYEIDSNYIRNFMRTGGTFCFALYILFAAIVYVAAPFIVGKWINLKSMDPGTALDIIRILGISSLLTFPRSFYASAFRGLQRMEYNNIIAVAQTSMQQIGIIIVLMRGGGIYVVSVWISFCYFCGLAAYMIIASLFFSRKALVPGFSTEVFRKIKGFATKMAAVSLLSLVQKQTDKVVMSKLLSIGTIGYFGFASSFVSKAGIIISSITGAAYPSFSDLFKQGKLVDLKKQYLKLQEFISVITVPTFAAVVFAAIPVTTYVFNEDIAIMLFLPSLLLAIGFYLNGTLNLQYRLILAIGKPDIVVRSSFYGLLIVTPITIFLVYNFGITGAAVSWIVFNVYVYIYVVPIVCKKFFKENLFKWYIRETKFLVMAIVSYGASMAVLKHFGTFGLLGLSIAYLAGTAVFFSVGIFFIRGSLRRSLIGNLRKIFGVVIAR